MNKLTEIGNGISVGIISISPEQAAKMLEKNTHNRGVKKGLVNLYALEINQGYWKFNGVPIVLAKNGQIIDGQHRLLAIIKAGISIQTLVVVGVDYDAFKTIDTGSNRTGKDVLTIHGVEVKKAGYLAPLIKRIWAQSKEQATAFSLQHAGMSRFGREYGRRTMNNQMIVEYYQNHKEVLDSVYGYCAPFLQKATNIMQFSLFLLVFYTFRKINIVDAELFVKKLATGADLSDNDSIYHLREKLISYKNSETEKITALHFQILVTKAWNAFRKRTPIQRLAVYKTETKAPKAI